MVFLSVFSFIGTCSWLQLINVNKFCLMVCRRTGSNRISYAQLFEFLVFEKKRKSSIYPGALVPHLICLFLLPFRIIPSPMAVVMHLSSTHMAVLLHNCAPANTPLPKQSQRRRGITVDSRCYLRESRLCRTQFLLFLL